MTASEKPFPTGREDLEPRGPKVDVDLPPAGTRVGGWELYAPLARVGDAEIIQTVSGGLVVRWPDGTVERCGMASLERVIADLTEKLASG